MTQTDKLYTGQQIENGDSALGLYNYKARFYGTTLGRFVSADTWSGDGLNRYTYTRNNPLAYDDPTGHGAVGIPGPGCVEDTPGDGSCDPPAPAVDPEEWANTVAEPGPPQDHPYGYCDAGCQADQATVMSGDTSPGVDDMAGVAGAAVGVAVTTASSAAADCSLSLSCAGQTLLKAVGTAAVPIGLGILGGILAPCDSYKCTTMNTAAKQGTPAAVGAVPLGRGRWRQNKNDRAQDILKGDEWQRVPTGGAHPPGSEEWDQIRGNKHRGVIIHDDGSIEAKQDWK